jgi:hypothetical protein
MIWVIEPHADDAFLSLHEHLLAWKKGGRDVTIVTIYSNPQRDGEAKAYADSVGAFHASLTITDQSHLGLPPRPIPPLASWPLPISPDDQWVFPLGLQHPDHKQVRGEAPDGAWFYLDTPYQAKLKLQAELMRFVRSRKIVSIRYPSKRKWRSIPIFKSQAKFFHFNPAESLERIPEIIVR